MITEQNVTWIARIHVNKWWKLKRTTILPVKNFVFTFGLIENTARKIGNLEKDELWKLPTDWGKFLNKGKNKTELKSRTKVCVKGTKFSSQLLRQYSTEGMRHFWMKQIQRLDGWTLDKNSWKISNYCLLFSRGQGTRSSRETQTSLS